MADVKGLLADPEFQKLDPSIQKSTLGKLDPEFSSLTDDQFNQFKEKLSPRKEPRRKDTLTGKEPGAQMSRPSFEDRFIDANVAGASALGVGELGGAAWEAISSNAIKSFLKKTIPKVVTGAVAGGATKGISDKLGLPRAVGDIAGMVAAGAAGYGEGKVGEFLRSIPKDVAKNPNPLAFFQWLAEKAKTNEVTAKLLPETSGPTANRPGSDVSKRSSYGSPAPKPPAPVNPRSLPEGVNLPVPPSIREMKPTTPPPGPSKDLSRNPISPQQREPTEDEMEFERTPKRTSPKVSLPTPKTTTPGAASTVDASKVKEAAEMVKSLGATPGSLKSAPQSQWDAIGKQLGRPVDENFKQAVIEEITPKAKPSPASGMRDAEPKTKRPIPGKSPVGEVKSTITKRDQSEAARLLQESPYANIARRIGDHLQRNGITEEQAERFTEADWKKVADKLRVDVPDDEVKMMAREVNRRNWSAQQQEREFRLAAKPSK